MKLFSKTHISWSEPWFFVLRLRNRKGWIKRVVAALGIATILFVAMQFDKRFGIWDGLGISLFAGVFLALLPDLPLIQREITIKDDCILCNGMVWQTYSMESFDLKDIQHVTLTRPEDWEHPFGGMLLNLGDDGWLMAVPNKVSLETVANILHRLEVSVSLEGWEPSESDTRVQVKDEVELPAEAAQFTQDARIWPVEERDGSLTPPLTIAVAIVLAFLPLLAALIGLIIAGVYLFMNWGALTILERSLIGGGAVGGLVVGFLYLLLVGQFLASRYLIRVGKKILRGRPNAQLSADSEGLIPVEIFDRAAWTSTVVRSVDSGFLQIDGARRELKFEGNKNRWLIPATAITKCKIEEAHVGSEGNENAEKRYYVVIAVNHEGEPWEAGMIHTRTELGSDGQEQRYARAQAFFGEISQLLQPGVVEKAAHA